MTDFQFNVPPSCNVTGRGTQESKLDEPLPVKRLDGEVTKLSELAFAGGPLSELWEGQWKKDGGKKEEVGSSFATSVLG